MTDSKRSVAIGVGLLLILALVAVIVLQRKHQLFMLRTDDTAGWQFLGGSWRSEGGVLSDTHGGRGDLALAKGLKVKDFSLTGDLRFDTVFPEVRYGDAGFAFRVSDATVGVDSFRGYYTGLRLHDQTLIFGRTADAFDEIASVPLQSPLRLGEWYRLGVSMQGCRAMIRAEPLAGGKPTTLTRVDPKCFPNGTIALRLYYAQASWRNLILRRTGAVVASP